MKKTFPLLAAMLISLQLFSQSTPKSWTWTELNWAPCSGVGINATAAFQVTAEVTDLKDKAKFQLSNLMVRAKTGVSKVHYSGSLIITAPGKNKESYLLEAPKYPAWESAEGPRVVLEVPQNDANRPKELIGDVFVCNNCTVEIVITMVADLSGGECVLGSTKHTLDIH